MGLDSSFYIGTLDDTHSYISEVCTMRNVWVLNQYIMVHCNDGKEEGKYIKVNPEILTLALRDIGAVIGYRITGNNKTLQKEIADMLCPVSKTCHIETGSDEYYENCVESIKYIGEILMEWVKCMRYCDGNEAISIYYCGSW